MATWLLNGMAGFNAIHFLIGFLVMVCVLAIVIIAARWLLSLAGIAVPQPLLMILGIVLFLLLLLWLLSWSGVYSFS